MNFPLPVVDVSGTPAEMGAGYGAQARDQIRANVEAYLERFDKAVGLSRASVIGQGALFHATTRQHFPRLAIMLDAMAGEAGLEPELIYAVNARSELLYGNPTCGSPGAEAGECTSIGVLDTHTV